MSLGADGCGCLVAVAQLTHLRLLEMYSYRCCNVRFTGWPLPPPRSVPSPAQPSPFHTRPAKPSIPSPVVACPPTYPTPIQRPLCRCERTRVRFFSLRRRGDCGVGKGVVWVERCGFRRVPSSHRTARQQARMGWSGERGCGGKDMGCCETGQGRPRGEAWEDCLEAPRERCGMLWGAALAGPESREQGRSVLVPGGSPEEIRLAFRQMGFVANVT